MVLGRGNSRHFFKVGMEEEDKDIRLLRRLDYETERQKKRVLQLIELDCRKVGMKIIADYTGVYKSYIYGVLKEERVISVKKTIELFYKVKEVLKVLRVDERNNRETIVSTPSIDSDE